MMEWLLASIDPTRPHIVDFATSWHGRIMTLSWGVIAPLAVLIARYFKILPGQHWPDELDNKVWWRSHWIGQTAGFGLSAIGFALVFWTDGGAWLPHSLIGYAVLAFGFAQILSGIWRGTKGGPTAPAPDGSWAGDHYDMTRHRLIFEMIHKSAGYVALALGAAAVLTGLWAANAPRWMWLGIAAWWLALLAAAVWLQRRGRAVDTYQAIWGPDERHPGNRLPTQGWGAARPSDIQSL
ncbi:MAG: cytochrome b561 domain-containing protein [Pseudomonadota bacterium]